MTTSQWTPQNIVTALVGGALALGISFNGVQSYRTADNVERAAVAIEAVPEEVADTVTDLDRNDVNRAHFDSVLSVMQADIDSSLVLQNLILERTP